MTIPVVTIFGALFLVIYFSLGVGVWSRNSDPALSGLAFSGPGFLVSHFPADPSPIWYFCIFDIIGLVFYDNAISGFAYSAPHPKAWYYTDRTCPREIH